MPSANSRRLAAIGFALSFAALRSAWAETAGEETSSLQGLLDQTVVVTASKTAETGTQSPATSTTLTAEDLRRYGIRTLDEAINFLSLGMLTSRQATEADVGGRGVILPHDQGNHVLLLIDGHAVNEPLAGAARIDRSAGIPLELVDHIEVILGPGSVLYGSNAMLGVINVITKSASSFSGVRLVGETEIGKSYRAMVAAGAEFSAFGRTNEIVTGVEFYRQRGPVFDYGPQDVGIDPVSNQPYLFSRQPPGTGVWAGRTEKGNYADVPAAYVRLRLGDFEARFHAGTATRGIPFTDSSHLTTYFDDADNYAIDRWARGEIAYRKALTSVTTVNARVYGDSWDARTSGLLSMRSGCRFDEVALPICRYSSTQISRWGGTEVQATFNWLRDARFVTLLGADGRVRFGQTKSDIFDDESGRPLGSSTAVMKVTDATLGAYAQQDWRITRSVGINVGGRFDHDPRFDPVLSPRAAFTLVPWRLAMLKLVYAEAFRAPSLIETNLPSTIAAGPLRPERVRSIEASLEQRFGAQKLFFGAFRSVWRDLVELHSLSIAESEAEVRAGRVRLDRSQGLTQYRNVSSIDNYGFNAGWEGTLVDRRLHYGLNVTEAIARQQATGSAERPLVIAPQLYGNARVSYALDGGFPTVALAASYMDRRLIDLAYNGAWPNYPTAPPSLELRATLSGPVPKISGLSYRIIANYAFNDRGPYLIGAGILQPGYMATHPPELLPVDRFRVGVGLEWNLWP